MISPNTSISPAVFRVSNRGQVSVPADARRRWGIFTGGEIEVFDLGDCVLLSPTGPRSVRAEVARVVTAERYREIVAAIDDPDLRDE